MKKSVVSIVVLTSLAAVVFLWFIARRELTAEQVATKFRDCALSGDAQCVYELIDPAEHRENGTTLAQTDAFLNEWFIPRYSGKLSPGAEIFGGSVGGEQVFRYVVQTKGGDRSLSIPVAKTDAGLRVSRFTSALIAGAGGYGSDGLPLRGVAKLKRLSEYLSQERETFARYGITRFYFGTGMTPMTIDEAIADVNRRIAKLSAEQ